MSAVGQASRLERQAEIGFAKPTERIPATPGGIPIFIDGVSKNFGSRCVLHPLTLEIPARQVVAIVGRSGCGKTTLLRLIAGLDPPTAGSLRLGDAATDGLRPSVRLLFQDARLLPWQKVIGNVGVARGAQWRDRALAALADVGLADRAEEWPAALSGGQRQRVALARALVSHPRILLLDEPFGALDALTRLEMHDLLTRVWQDRGFTTVLVTHDVAEAVALADRVIVLRDGRVALDEPIGLVRPRRAGGDPATARLQAKILGSV